MLLLQMLNSIILKSTLVTGFRLAKRLSKHLRPVETTLTIILIAYALVILDGLEERTILALKARDVAAPLLWREGITDAGGVVFKTPIFPREIAQNVEVQGWTEPTISGRNEKKSSIYVGDAQKGRDGHYNSGLAPQIPFDRQVMRLDSLTY